MNFYNMLFMCERFTNQHLDFYKQIKIELTLPVQSIYGEETKAIFFQSSELPNECFAIHYIKGRSGKLVLRRWNSQFDNERFSLGIYNLDRIAISESIFNLSNLQVEQLDKLIVMGHSVQNFDGIMLDGYSFSLSFFSGNLKKHFEWKIESQLSQATSEFVAVLKQMAVM